MSEKEPTNLDPWRAVIGLLFEEGSDVVIRVIDRAGLAVDWDIPVERSGTHKERKREYRPRVERAYARLSRQEKMMAASAVTAELASLSSKHLDQVNQNLGRIGWKMIDGQLINDRAPTPDEATAEEIFANLVRPQLPSKVEGGVIVNIATESQVAPSDPAIIFVVHGRNEPARRALFEFLRAIGLKPREFSQLVQDTGKGAPYIGEILEAAFAKAQAVVVLMTPDDFAYLREPLRGSHEPHFETEPTGQARPNVLFEAGMAMGKNPKRIRNGKDC